jgi:hypothetical protein
MGFHKKKALLDLLERLVNHVRLTNIRIRTWNEISVPLQSRAEPFAIAYSPGRLLVKSTHNSVYGSTEGQQCQNPELATSLNVGLTLLLPTRDYWFFLSRTQLSYPQEDWVWDSSSSRNQEYYWWRAGWTSKYCFLRVGYSCIEGEGFGQMLA